MVLQVAMAMDMNRYTPNSSAKPSTGNTPIAVTVAANATKLPLDTAAAPLNVTSMTALVRAVLKPAKNLISSIKAKRLSTNLCRILAVYRNRGQSSELAFKFEATRGLRPSLRYGKFSGI